jgi:hypothetical protein
MAEEDDTKEPKEADIEAKEPAEPQVPEEPEEAGTPKKKGPSAEGFLEIVKGIGHIPKERPGGAEPKSEPHTHLLMLIILVCILGVIIAFTNI